MIMHAFCRNCGGVERVGRIFWERLRLLVGKGDIILFWEHLWVGDMALKLLFP